MPTGHTLPPPPVKQRPTAVMTFSRDPLPADRLSATSVPTTDGEAGTSFRVMLRWYRANSARYFSGSATGFRTTMSR
jgi:hypothetical protein